MSENTYLHKNECFSKYGKRQFKAAFWSGEKTKTCLRYLGGGGTFKIYTRQDASLARVTKASCLLRHTIETQSYFM